MDQGNEQDVIQTQGLGAHAQYIVLGPNPSVLLLMSLKRDELRTALSANNVPFSGAWRKNELANRLYEYITAHQAAMAEAAAQPEQEVQVIEEDQEVQQPQLGQAPQPMQAPQLFERRPTCMVCLDRVSEWAFSNCMHIGVCAGCKENLLQLNGGLMPCPVCRVEHDDQEIKRFFLIDPDII